MINDEIDHANIKLYNIVMLNKLYIFIEFFEFLVKNRKFWLIPIVLILLLLGLIIILSQGSALAPFIYTLF